jgi:hypothetical protein
VPPAVFEGNEGGRFLRLDSSVSSFFFFFFFFRELLRYSRFDLLCSVQGTVSSA